MNKKYDLRIMNNVRVFLLVMDKTAAVRFQRVIPIKVGIVGNRQWRIKTQNGAVLRMEGRRKAQRHGADSAGKKVMTLPRVDGFVAPASGGE